MKNFLSSLIAAGQSIRIESNSNEIKDLAVDSEDGFTSSSTLFDKLLNALAASLNNPDKNENEKELKINLNELNCLLKTSPDNGNELKSSEVDSKDNLSSKNG